MATIRYEESADTPAIRRVVEQAFGQPNEADLVDALRRRGAVTLSLVAVEDHQIIGHILFSPVTIALTDTHSAAIGLGPLAVLPDHQRQGIGSQLVRIGLEQCRQAGHKIVVVLGHPDFYRRFGFGAASQYGIRCEFDVPEEAFMVKALEQNALAGLSGIVRYRPEFSRV